MNSKHNICIIWVMTNLKYHCWRWKSVTIWHFFFVLWNESFQSFWLFYTTIWATNVSHLIFKGVFLCQIFHSVRIIRAAQKKKYSDTPYFCRSLLLILLSSKKRLLKSHDIARPEWMDMPICMYNIHSHTHIS